MPVYGLRPDDVVVDAAGNVQSGATLTLHATQADAEAGTSPLATVTTAAGRWTADVDVAPVWVRTPSGAVYQIEDFAAKADVSYVDAQIGGLSSTFAGLGVVRPNAVAPLDIPTPDGLPSVGHCSVVVAPEGAWNGWRYWMAFTPYPAAPRENPCIVVSQDGINWEVPAGLSNPVVPLSFAQAEGYEYNADTDLVFDGDTLVMHFRPASETGTTKEAVYRTTSTDGVTWTAPVKVLSNDIANDTLLSPCVRKLDATWHMWVVDATVDNVTTLKHYTSADGVTWGAPTVGSYPSGVLAWHIDVQYAAGKWWTLIYDKTTPDYLVMLSSDDGNTWAGNTTYSLPKSGLAYDAGGFYRSCMIPRNGHPLRWDLWVTGRNSGGTTWRIGYVPDFDWAKAATDDANRRAHEAVTKRNLTVVADGFERRSANGVGRPDVGAAAWTWTGTGTPSISGTPAKLVLPNISNAALLTTGTANGRLSLECWLAASGNADGGIAFRSNVDATTLLFATLTKGASTDRVALWKRTGGASTKLAEDLAAGLVYGRSYLLEVRAYGASITVSVDGVQKLTHTLTGGDETTFGSGTYVGVWGPGGSPINFKNFVQAYR